MKTIVLTDKELKHFQDWLNLDWYEISWEGKYTEQFQLFWETIFTPPSVPAIVNRLEFCKSLVKSGPLHSWLSWLKEKFFCYIFIHYELSILELADFLKIPTPDLASILRNFFGELFPEKQIKLNDFLQIGNLASPQIHLRYENLLKDVLGREVKVGSSSQDMMTNIEVTLTPSWPKLIKTIEKDFQEKNTDIGILKDKESLKKSVKFWQEVLLLLLVGTILISGFKWANKKYEVALAEKIKILGNKLSFEYIAQNFLEKNEKEHAQEQIELELKEIASTQDQGEQLQEDFMLEERIGVESDVTLLSEDMPKDFELVDTATSNYEEEKKGGYRDYRYGNRKVYRVLMRSVDPGKAREKIAELISNLEINQADNVRPGTDIPGGIYYNLYVPNNNLGDFLQELRDVDASDIFESKTRASAPPGYSKVFVWIKTI